MHMTNQTTEAPQVPTGYSGPTRIGVILFAVALAVALSISFYRGQRARHKATVELKEEVERTADAPMTVDVVHVHPAASGTSLSLPGEARSFYETTIFARTSGYVSKWLVDIGDKVKEGQTLALIETPELDDQLVAAKAKVDELRSEVHVAETAAKLAKVSFDRWNKLTPSGAVSGQEHDQKQAEWESSQAKLEAANAQVTLAQADVKRLTTLTGFKKVAAPFDGVITQRHIDIGALVTAGSTTSTTPLYSVSQADQIRVYVDVPQVAVTSIKIDMPVTATSREYPGRTFTGKVDRTASSIDMTSKTLRVEVLVPNKDLALLPGMYLQVNFESNRQHPPLQVPAGAICFRPGGAQVAVVTADDRVEMRDIKISRDLGESVEIEGEGIVANTMVALNVGNDVTSGARVEPHDVDAPAVAEAAAVR
jgi:RND family efflux transporter MFP subunit